MVLFCLILLCSGELEGAGNSKGRILIGGEVGLGLVEVVINFRNRMTERPCL